MARLKTAIRHILPIFIARRLYRWWAETYIDGLKDTVDRSRKTLLAINHHWSQDLRALQWANTRFNFVTVDAPRLFKGAKIHFAEDVIAFHAPYDGESEDHRRQWREECERIFGRLQSRFGVDLIVTPSDQFYWIREFIAVAREHGARTVVIDKEGVMTPQFYESEVDRRRSCAPYMSDHMFVWSERQRHFWLKAGVPEDSITVIGQPRSDLFHRERRQDVDELFPSAQPLVTLFSYADDAYIPIHLRIEAGLTWKKMKTESHDEVRRLARQHPDYNFVIKTHPQQPDLAKLQAKYECENLRVVGGSEIANELIQRSELIIAFQTTAVIEAMFLGKHVIYTCWDSLISRLESDLLPLHEAGGICVARTLYDFRQMCAQFFEGNSTQISFSDEDLRRRDEFINRYFYKPDGRVGERFFQKVDQLLL